MTPPPIFPPPPNVWGKISYIAREKCQNLNIKKEI